MDISEIIKEELKKRKLSPKLEKQDLIALAEKKLENRIREEFKKISESLYDSVKTEITATEKFAVELKYNGYRALIHKKGNNVKIFSDQGKDISFPFPTIIEQAKKLTTKDYILDSELVPYLDNKPMGRDYAARYIGAVKSHKDISDSDVRVYVFDILYLDKPLINLQYYERIKILKENIFFTRNIKEAKRVIVNNISELRKAVEEFSNIEGSEGAIIKRLNYVYTPGKKSDAWIKFRVEIPLNVVIIDVLPVRGTDAVRYEVGIYISDEESKRIDPKYLTKIGNKPVLTLGHTFNTSLIAERGELIEITVEEIWRHKKGSKYHYSIHKPNVRKRTEKQTSSLEYIEEKVVSRGYEIIENELSLRKEKTKEGQEIEIADFPKRLQENFLKLKEENKWMPYVVQWHYRGHIITDLERKKENIPDEYIYKLDSLHADVRHLVDSGYLEGITVLSPTSTDQSVEDYFNKCEEAKQGKIRAVLKLIEPKGWLNVEGIADIGEPGSTPKAPGVFVIVSKGEYRILDVSDHIIKIQYKSKKGYINKKPIQQARKRGIYITREPEDKLKDLTGIWQYQIAHIGDKHIILLRLLEGLKSDLLSEELIEKINEFSTITNKISKEQCIEIVNLTIDNTMFRPEIATKYNISQGLVYKLQKHCGLI